MPTQLTPPRSALIALALASLASAVSCTPDRTGHTGTDIPGSDAGHDAATDLADSSGADAAEAPPHPLEDARRVAVAVVDQRLTDALGRQVVLRGVNARIEGVFDVTFDDGRERLQPLPDFTEADAMAMSAAGFNFLRLPVNWSGIEPEEGQFDTAYLERVDAVIELCERYGIRVLVDFHQDAWSKHIGEDGAPLWAIVPPPTALLEGPLNDLNARRASAQVLAASRSFFANTDGLQDRFIPAWKHLAARYADRAIVVGFQPMNEPVVALAGADNEQLYAFYDRTLAALREVNPTHAFWVEPDSLRNLLNEAPLADDPLPDSNVVYCPHLYPGVSGTDFSTASDWSSWLAEPIAGMFDEAASWEGALVVGEWGADPRSASFETYAQPLIDALADEGGGWAFWVWKEISQGFWGFFDQAADGTWVERATAFAVLGQPYVSAVPGVLTAHRWDPVAQTLQATFTSAGSEGPLELRGARLGTGTLELTIDDVTINTVAGPGWAAAEWQPTSGEHTLHLALVP